MAEKYLSSPLFSKRDEDEIEQKDLGLLNL